MHNVITITLIYIAPVLLCIAIYGLIQQRRSRRSQRIYSEAVESGMTEPASLHPVIDNLRCLGCATCVKACPEHDVLGIMANKARLISPTSCIGHGACKEACPTNAIELVFGTATRGVDIPRVGKDFQTNVEGIYIAGELGGMGLIRNAIEQGRQAIGAIAVSGRVQQAGQLDVLIVGAGPAGISAALAAKELGLSYRVLEQDTIGGTIAHYPRGKIVMTAPAKLPIIGEFQFAETSKEKLMAFWAGAVKQAGLEISEGQRVDNITPIENGFEVDAGQAQLASNVLLTIGRRGTPRKLGVPGEDHSKVVYRLLDPQQYQGKKVLVVGGGDSALEAALSLAEVAATEVVLSYRSEAFSRAKSKNRERLAEAEKTGQLRVELASTITSIEPLKVNITTVTGKETLSNDIVIVCAGGILPTGFLDSMGVEVETRFGTV